MTADLLNIFEVFLPQLLLYPNPLDPLNGDAASLLLKDQIQYEKKVKGKKVQNILVGDNRSSIMKYVLLYVTGLTIFKC